MQKHGRWSDSIDPMRSTFVSVMTVHPPFPVGNTYWFNEVTGESTYDEPPVAGTEDEYAESGAEEGQVAEQTGVDVGGGWAQFWDESGNGEYAKSSLNNSPSLCHFTASTPH